MIAAGFILLTILMACLVYAVFTSQIVVANLDTHSHKKFRAAIICTLVCWLAYITTASLAGFFQSGALPPRIPLGLVAPAFAFTIWFFASRRFHNIITAIPASWLVYAQVFRVMVELLLFSLYKQGILPVSTTFEGYNYEIIIGLSAPIMGYLAVTKQILPKWTLVLWNIAGLCTLATIVFIFISHAYRPSMWTDGTLSINDFGAFPYTLLPGFLMPLAVFMHIFSIVKTKRYTS